MLQRSWVTVGRPPPCNPDIRNSRMPTPGTRVARKRTRSYPSSWTFLATRMPVTQSTNPCPLEETTNRSSLCSSKPTAQSPPTGTSATNRQGNGALETGALLIDSAMETRRDEMSMDQTLRVRKRRPVERPRNPGRPVRTAPPFRFRWRSARGYRTCYAGAAITPQLTSVLHRARVSRARVRSRPRFRVPQPFP